MKRAGLIAVLLCCRIAFCAEHFVTVRRVPDRGLEPRAAVDAAGTLHLIYFTGDPAHGDVFYVRSADGGETFSNPLRVNSEAGGALVVGAVRGPQMAVGRNGRVHVAWNGSGRAKEKSPVAGAPMLYTRRNDAGDAFEPQRNLMTRSGHLDGGGSIAADDGGHVYVAWHGVADKNETESARRVWLARSDDEGKTFSRESSADVPAVGACACCAVQLFTAADASPRVLFRSATESVHRDMYLLAFDPPGLRKLSEWRIGTCAMSTAASAGDRLAWESRDRILFATAGEMTKFQSIGKENPKHPALAVAADGTFLLAWTEKTGWNKGGSLAWQVFDAAGKPVPDTAGRADDLPTWDYPAAAALGDGRFVIFY